MFTRHSTTLPSKKSVSVIGDGVPGIPENLPEEILLCGKPQLYFSLGHPPPVPQAIVTNLNHSFFPKSLYTLTTRHILCCLIKSRQLQNGGFSSRHGESTERISLSSNGGHNNWSVSPDDYKKRREK